MPFTNKKTKLESDALFRIRYEPRYLFFGFLLTASVSTLTEEEIKEAEY